MISDEPRRPDPDALLAEAKRQGRGRLRVYLGMAPGVGKTYEMLTAGERRKTEGVDVVVGVVETQVDITLDDDGEVTSVIETEVVDVADEAEGKQS